MSAYVSNAVAKQAENDGLEEMLDEMLITSGGPMRRSERAWADGALGLRSTRKR